MWYAITKIINLHNIFLIALYNLNDNIVLFSMIRINFMIVYQYDILCKCILNDIFFF